MKEKIKNMNSKMIINLQLSTTEPKKKKKERTEQTTRTGPDSQQQRSHGGLSLRKGGVENGGKGTGNMKPKWQVQNRQRDVKNSIGKGEGRELTCQPMDMN